MTVSPGRMATRCSSMLMRTSAEVGSPWLPVQTMITCSPGKRLHLLVAEHLRRVDVEVAQLGGHAGVVAHRAAHQPDPPAGPAGHPDHLVDARDVRREGGQKDSPWRGRMIWSSDCSRSLSEGVKPALSALVESESSSRTPRSPSDCSGQSRSAGHRPDAGRTCSRSNRSPALPAS